jgi:hypothetical protein
MTDIGNDSIDSKYHQIYGAILENDCQYRWLIKYFSARSNPDILQPASLGNTNVIVAEFFDNPPYKTVQALTSLSDELQDTLCKPSLASVRLLVVASISGVRDEAKQAVRFNPLYSNPCSVLIRTMKAILASPIE